MVEMQYNVLCLVVHWEFKCHIFASQLLVYDREHIQLCVCVYVCVCLCVCGVWCVCVVCGVCGVCV